MINEELTTTLDQILKNQESIKTLLHSREKPFLSITEAAAYLNMPKGTIYHFTSKGILPYHKLNNRRVYFCIEDLNDFILNRDTRISSKAEIEQKSIDKIVNKTV